MNYVKYELYKLFNIKYLWIIIIIFFCANILLCIHTINQEMELMLPRKDINNFFEIYSKNPKLIEDEYEKLLIIQEEHEQLLYDAMLRYHYEYELELIPDKYIDSDINNDISLFNEVFNKKNYILEYPILIERVIQQTYYNIEEFNAMNISPQSYIYQYQLEIIKFYTDAKANVDMIFEYTHGWNSYFNYDNVNVFIFFILIMLSCNIFIYEKHSGFYSIMRTSKNGRVKTVFAKIGTMAFITVAVVILFTFSTWVVYGIKLGFSNPANAIQVFDEFKFTPFIITVGQYFAITIFIKLFVFTLFSVLILMFSIFLHNSAIIYICGFSLFGVNFFLYTFRYLNADNPLKNLNFIAVATVNPLFVRYRSINFFGNVCGYVPFMTAAFSILVLTALTVIVVAFSRMRDEITTKRFYFILDILYKYKLSAISVVEKLSKIINLKKQVYSRSLFLSEIYKTLIPKRYILIVVCLLLVKGYISSNQFAPMKSYNDSIYMEYMTILEGCVTDEKRQYITDERIYINDVLLLREEMRTKYISDKITYDEYSKYMTEYNYAYSRNELFTRIEDHTRYINQTKTEKDIDIWFLYDTGWLMLFHNSFDIALYAILLLMFSGSFADEYITKSSSGGFVQILRTTRYGREHVFVKKLQSAVTITTILTFVCNAIDIIWIDWTYGIPAINAPLLSLQSFSNVDSGITIMQYLIFHVIFKLVGNILFTLFLCGLSELFKKIIPVMSVTVALTLFPSLFVYFGLNTFKIIDFTGLLAVTPLYLLSASRNLFGDMGLFIIFVTVVVFIVSTIIIYSRRLYIK